MPIDSSTLLFFDASCLIAAAGSPTGGSSFLLAVCARGFLRAAVSHLVLGEAEGNILTNLPAPAWQRYQQQILTLPLLVAPIPTREECQATTPIAGGKDAHVLASARSVAAPFLIALDQRLIQRVNEASLPLRALTPGDFITSELPHHPAYPVMRS